MPRHPLVKSIRRFLRPVKRFARQLVYSREHVWVEEIAGDSLVSTGRLLSLKHLAEGVNREAVPGDFVECGTYNGGSAVLLATLMGAGRHLWLYDSFQGFPATHQLDGKDARSLVGNYVGDETHVRVLLEKAGIIDRDFTIRKGWFEETFREPLPAEIALLHCDADLYESVLLTLRTLYPRVVPGGCVILDDFGYWEGTREAFYDFCKESGEKPLVERVEIDQVYWIKGRTHNRP